MVVTQIKLQDIQNNAATFYSADITHVAIGSGGTSPLESDTTLATETFRKLADNVSTIQNESRTRVRFDVTENNGNTVREIGAFDASSGGSMSLRNLTTVKAKTATKEFFYLLRNIFTASNE
jgi:hypothetical protein